jgi:DNA replication licensing factor MCM3
LDHVFTTALGQEGMLDMDELLPLVNEGMETADMFGSGEARKAAEKMHEKNEIMFSEGTVYKV